MIERLLLLLCFLSLRQQVRAATTSRSMAVTTLPGFHGRLPFHLETGYVEVDEKNGAELFYYFVEAEAGGENAPFLLWLTGGGPVSFVIEPYNGTLPRLEINPYSWTKLEQDFRFPEPPKATMSEKYLPHCSSMNSSRSGSRTIPSSLQILSTSGETPMLQKLCHLSHKKFLKGLKLEGARSLISWVI